MHTFMVITKTSCIFSNFLGLLHLSRYFKTYRLNMDHFDMVMGTLQRRGGWEDVPTPQQFRYAYKQLFRQLSNNSFINIDFDGEDITVDQGEACIYKNERAEDPYYLEYPVFTDLETDIMHNATSVVGKVLQRLSCPNCVNVLLDDNPESYCKGNMVVLNIIKPSKFVLKLLKNSRRILKWEESNKDECEQLVLLASCKYFTVFESLDFQEETLEHFIEEPLHIICLVKAVIRCYFSRIFYARKKLRRVYT
ncbi:hypothetical protein SK128_026961 [Halocaridina rubra]|uniref:Transposable element P transposase-like RNase H C-terminal domain-containing protein n=1 Tax=Halocaridina rubra TaxID=373956 RepID=A0AAN8X4I4_HALRR